MYFNNYILVLLYLPVVYFYISYIDSINKPNILGRSKKYFNKIIIVIVIGILLSMLVGYNSGKFPTDLSQIDLYRIINFLLIFIIPIVITKTKLIRNKTFRKIFDIGLFAFVLLVGYSLFSRGLGKSAFPGNFFGATTINLTMVSAISYYGLFFYYLQNKVAGLVLSVLAWLIAFASLAKWNFWIDVTIPVLVYRAWVFGAKRNVLQKIIIIFFSIGLFFVVLYPNIKGYLNTFASFADYNSFNSYLDSRVFRTVTADNNIASGTVFDYSGKGISDGARLTMWNDLLQRTTENPFAGLGLGVRALDYKGSVVEDHSILIFFLSRFGFILFALFVIYLYKVLKSLYVFSKNEKYPLLKYIYVALIGNFLFQGMVGMIWGQLPVTLLLGIILSIFFREISQKKLSAHV